MAEISVEDKAFLNSLISSDSFGNASFYEKPTVGDKVAILPLFNRNNNTYHYDDFRDYNPEIDKNLSFMRKSVWLGNKQDSEIVYFIIDSDSCPIGEYPNLPIELQYALFSIVSVKNKRIPKFFDELVRVNGISFLDTVFDAMWRDSQDKENMILPTTSALESLMPLNIKRDKTTQSASASADTGFLFISFVNEIKNEQTELCYSWLYNMRSNTRFIMTLSRYANVNSIMSVILGENWFSTIVGENAFNKPATDNAPNMVNSSNSSSGEASEGDVLSDSSLKKLNFAANYYNIYMKDFDFDPDKVKNTAILHGFFSTLLASTRARIIKDFVSRKDISGNGQTLSDILPIILRMLENPKNKAILAHAMDDDLNFTIAMLFQIASDYTRFKNNFPTMLYIAENAIVESMNEFFEHKREFIAKNGEKSYNQELAVYEFHNNVATDLFNYLIKLDRLSKFTESNVCEQDISNGNCSVNVQCNSYIRAITKENIDTIGRIGRVLLSNISCFSADMLKYFKEIFCSVADNSSTTVTGGLSYMLVFHEFLTILSQKFGKSDDKTLVLFLKNWVTVGAGINDLCLKNYNVIKKLNYGYNFMGGYNFNGNISFISLLIMTDLLKNGYFDTMTIEMIIEHIKMSWFAEAKNK